MSDAIHQKTITIERCLREKLALIPDTKLLITNNFFYICERRKHFKRNTWSVFVKQRRVNHIAGPSDQAFRNTGPHFSDAGITKNFPSRWWWFALAWCSNTRKFVVCSVASEDGTILVDKPKSSRMRHSLSYILPLGFYPGYLRGRSFPPKCPASPPKNIFIITVYKLLYRKNHPDATRSVHMK